jgi:hypothetical protein
LLLLLLLLLMLLPPPPLHNVRVMLTCGRFDLLEEMLLYHQHSVDMSHALLCLLFGRSLQDLPSQASLDFLDLSIIFKGKARLEVVLLLAADRTLNFAGGRPVSGFLSRGDQDPVRSGQAPLRSVPPPAAGAAG